MTLTSIDQLSPDSGAALDRYLAAVDAAMRPLDPRAADETAEDLREHALGALSADATPADVAALAEKLGAPATFAAGLSAADDVGSDAAAAPDASAPQGRLLGMPYDLRVPTVERVAARWWSPRDPRIIVPRVFGLGWTINFGAAAVQLGLIEPDAEDVPFASVPDAVLSAAMIVPVAFAAAIGLSYLALRSHLPATLPSHWGVAGTPDAWAPQLTAFGWAFGIAAVSALAAVWAVILRQPRPTAAVLIGGATFFSALAAGVWALTLSSALGVQSAWALPLLMLVALPLGSAFAVFVRLARAGRAAEQARDLGR
jgi:hypothetical protein